MAGMESLSENGVSAVAALMELAGKRKTLDVSRLGHLKLEAVPDGELGHGSFNFAGEAFELEAEEPVLVLQGKVRVAVVRRYIEELDSCDVLEEVIVTDRPGGGWWHLDGLHRLVASRLLGRGITASVWR